MNKLEKSRKKKTTRREFLTTAGVLAAGTLVAGNALAGELKGRILAPKVVKKADPKLTLKAALEKARARADANLDYKVTTPTGNTLTIREIKNNQAAVMADIKNIVNEILKNIDLGNFTVPDLIGGMDSIRIDPGSISGDFNLDFGGNGCYGFGPETDEGGGCGEGCPEAKGGDCGDKCDGALGDNCGGGCPASFGITSENAFIATFIDDVPRNLNYLDPAINTIFHSYSHEILGQVLLGQELRRHELRRQELMDQIKIEPIR